MTLDELEEFKNGRRSVRQLKKNDAPDDLLKKAVALATWALNGENFHKGHLSEERRYGKV